MIGHVNANGSITLSCMVGDGPGRFMFRRTFYGYSVDECVEQFALALAGVKQFVDWI